MFDHDKINFEVEKFSLWDITPQWDGSHDMDQVPKDLGIGLRRKDTKVPIAIVSEGYKPVQYEEIVNGVEASLVASGLQLYDAVFDTQVHRGGAQLELTARFPAHQVSIGNRHDIIMPELCFRTSHDSSWANNGMMGMWRSKCYNSLVDGDKLAYIYGRHTKNFSIDGFAAKVRTAADYISSEGTDKMRKWYHTNVPRHAVVHMFENTLAKKIDNVTTKNKPNQTALASLMKTFDKENQHLHGNALYGRYTYHQEGSLWSAYNAATEWSTHINTGTDAPQNTRIIRETKVKKMLNSSSWKELEAA